MASGPVRRSSKMIGGLGAPTRTRISPAFGAWAGRLRDESPLARAQPDHGEPALVVRRRGEAAADVRVFGDHRRALDRLALVVLDDAADAARLRGGVASETGREARGDGEAQEIGYAAACSRLPETTPEPHPQYIANRRHRRLRNAAYSSQVG